MALTLAQHGRVCLAALLLALASAPAAGLDVPRPDPEPQRKVQDLVERGFASPLLSRRVAAREALLHMGPEVGPALVPSLEDPRYPVRLWTVLTLGDLDYAPALPALIRLTGRRDSLDLEFSWALAKSLAKLGKTRLPLLRKALTRVKGPGRAIIVKALGLVSMGDIIAYMARFIDEEGQSGSYQGQFADLMPLGESAVIALLEILSLGEGDVPEDYFPEDLVIHARNRTWVETLKWLSVLALGELGNPMALPTLETTFASYFEQVDYYLSKTRACAFACWKLGNRGPIRIFLRYMVTRRARFGDRETRMSHHFDLGYTYNMILRTEEALAEYEKCVRLYRSHPQGQNRTPLIAQYNIACLYAMQKNVSAGLRALALSVDLGYDDYSWMQKDGDLLSLQADPRFDLVMARIFIKRARTFGRHEIFNTINLEEALEHVQRAVDRGLLPCHWIGADNDYKLLRSLEGYPLLAFRMALRALRKSLGRPF
jgi:HEAT repeat protein